MGKYIIEEERDFKNNNQIGQLLLNLEKLEFLFNTIYTKQFMFTGIKNQAPCIRELIIDQYDEEGMKAKRKYNFSQLSLIHSLIEMNSYNEYTKEIDTLYQDLCSMHIIFIDDTSGIWDYRMKQSKKEVNVSI